MLPPSYIPAPPRNCAPYSQNLAGMIVPMQRVYEIQKELRQDSTLRAKEAVLLKVLLLIKEVLLVFISTPYRININ